MRELKRMILLLLFITIVGIGGCLSLKAAVGVGAWDAMIQTFSFMSGIKVGTLGIMLNLVCVIGQAIILRKNFRLNQLLQIPISIFLGVVVNFIFYEVLYVFTIDSYLLNIILLILSYIISSFGIAVIIVLDIVIFPVEGLCMAISSKTGYEFSKTRQLLDIISIIVVIVFTFIFSVKLTLREGTIIGMLIFGPLMGLFIKNIKSVFIKYRII